jgi:hypothetical protein
MTIRVLRLVEYNYPDAKRMEEDMARWTIPANGSHQAGNMVIKSATLPLEVLDDPDAG